MSTPQPPSLTDAPAASASPATRSDAAPDEALCAFADAFAELCVELFIAGLVEEGRSTNGGQK